MFLVDILVRIVLLCVKKNLANYQKMVIIDKPTLSVSEQVPFGK